MKGETKGALRKFFGRAGRRRKSRKVDLVLKADISSISRIDCSGCLVDRQRVGQGAGVDRVGLQIWTTLSSVCHIHCQKSVGFGHFKAPRYAARATLKSPSSILLPQTNNTSLRYAHNSLILI